MITFDHLSKHFGTHRAVDDLSFTVPPGEVTGFLGPNGAGKSTSLRMACSLTRPTAGHVTIDGRSFAEFPNPARVVGVMLDASAQHAGRTGRETLRLAAMATHMPRRRVDELLELVGLREAAGKRVGRYSLGMRQRLGLAVALMGDPRILILDEPANGLDPAGIRWIRSLLDDFARSGGTVLLSSHLLGEIQAVADRVVVIDKGKLRQVGPVAELLRGSTTWVRTPDPERLADALAAHGLDAHTDGDGRLLAEADPEIIAAIAQAAGVLVTGIDRERHDIEDLYLSLTSA